MYGIDMWYTVKTLLERGKSLRGISRELGINRKTVTKIRDEIKKGTIKPPVIQKGNLLEPYRDFILELCEKQLTSVLIHRKLKQEKGLEVSYSSVLRFVNSLKHSEVYIPVETPPGEEAQVDFGYLGVFYNNGKSTKVWVFSMQLSYSRYAYYEIVLNQSTSTFIQCHINAFEYFGGVPKTVKIDNLKSAVLEANFYEPTIQTQYSQFLSHFGSAPVTARIRRGQDKGKVESGIKYVKNNFLKGLGHRKFDSLSNELEYWNNTICNQRIHGTTRKVPLKIFETKEKEQLQKLPSSRFELFQIEKRIVKPNMHISYGLNYYSVPWKYTNKEVIVKSNGKLLKIYADREHISTHSIEHSEKGKYITHEQHKPPYKQKKSEQQYAKQALEMGEHVYSFLRALQSEKPYHWHRLITGVFNLKKSHDIKIINSACKRALDYQAHSYLSVKNICEKGLYEQEYDTSLTVNNACGFNHDLSKYDKLN